MPKGKFLLFVLLSLSSLLAENAIELPPMPELNHHPEAGKTYIQPYEILDRRYCQLTPDPVLCWECLSRNFQFVRVLKFDEAGIPSRFYGCRPFDRPFIQ